MQKFILLTKAQKFANQAGYYLLNGRWHSIKQDKATPKGAPIAAHPSAAGQYDPVQHLSDAEWQQLSLPAENTNAGTFNKQLAKIKEMADAGHVSGILGMQYGTNTYGKKLAIIANHILELYGVEHKVTPGQKVGTHPAIQAAAEAPAKQDEASASEKAADATSGEAEVPAPAFQEGKTTKGVVAYYDKVAAKVNEFVAAGDLAGLEKMKADGLVPNKKGKVSNTWAGKTANSKLLLGMYDAAVEKLGGAQDQKPVKQPEPEVAAPAAEKPAADQKPVKNEAKPKEHSQHKLPDLDAVVSKMPQGLTASNGGAVAEQILAAYKSGDLKALKNTKDALFTPTFTGKVLYDGKAKKAMESFLDAAIADLQSQSTETAKPKKKGSVGQALADAAAKKDEKPAQAEPAAPAVDAGSAKEKLDQIPWADLILPDSNTNAKSHNGKVAQIKAMAYAGDAEGLAAFKAGKNTYGKKQNLLAQTALAALQEGTPAADSAQPAPKATAAEAETQAEQAPAAENKSASEAVSKPEPSWAEKVAEAGSQSAAQQVLDQYIEESGHTPEAYYVASELAKQNGYSGLVTLYGNEKKSAQEKELAAEQDSGPKDGDTKPGANGMLVFKNGRWHKMDDDEQASDQHPVDAIPLPDMFKLSKYQQDKVTAALELLKENAKQDGAAAFKGAIKNMKATGKTILTLPSENGGKLKIHVYGAGSATSNIKDYVEALKAAAGGKAAKPKAQPKQPAAAAPVTDADGIEVMDSWTQTGGQGGSNPGGKFKDQNGVEWYCKFPSDPDVAKSEILASKLYAAAGVAGQNAKLIKKDGKIGIASKWTEVSKASSPTALKKVEGVVEGFAVDAWLGNWDVVGMAYDNLQVGSDGKAIRIDAGGSLTYRAQGGKKAFTDQVTELDSLRDASINPQAAAVFGKLSKADITASVKKVLAIHDSTIELLVNQHAGGTAEEKKALAATLIARKADLAKKFPKAASKPKQKPFKPEKISAPPSFMDWGGSGKPGPSSKDFLNASNERAVQKIFEVAKTGDIAAVEKLEFPTYSKETGEIVGKKPALEHPSQHVKGYAQQVINEINYQKNPPKRFRFEGGHPLHALHDSFPAYKGVAHAENAGKIGKYILLGEPGKVDLDVLGLPKITYASGALTTQTYAKQAQDAVEKMPATQKQAVKAYTGSGYSTMNHSLWDGNPSGQAKSAAEALHTLGHDIAPGTVLSRKLNISGSDLQQLLGSTGKILQEPAIMSTSIRPSSWGGNVQLKLHVGPGVKGLWVGHGSVKGGGALSNHASEDEMILPPNTRMLVVGIKQGADSDGFGQSSQHVIEAIILPTN